MSRIEMDEAYQLDVVGIVRTDEDIQREPLYRIEEIIQAVSSTLRRMDRDHYVVLYFDSNMAPLGTGFIQDKGNTDETVLSMNEILKDAILACANAAIILSNHRWMFSTDPYPEERRMYSIISRTLALMDIKTLDYIITSGMCAGYCSFRDYGWLKKPMLHAVDDFWKIDFSSRRDFSGMIGIADRAGMGVRLEKEVHNVVGSPPHNYKRGGPKL